MKWFFRLLGKTIIWLSGWKVDQRLKADFSRCVMVAAPHTSNWDFVLARAAFEVMEIPVRFTIKKEWVDGPLGFLIKALGAIGIDRKPKKAGEPRLSYVEAMTHLFEEQERLVVLVTPEGTRSKASEWKTGFYHVAKAAGVPIALGYLDYGKKVAGIGKVLELSDSMEKDMHEIMAFYSRIEARFPENYSPDLRFYP
jgi:1-acyl-sn-glycerol-3-phosphate acyltransferase